MKNNNRERKTKAHFAVMPPTDLIWRYAVWWWIYDQSDFRSNAYDKDTQTEKLASDTVSATEIRRIRAVYQRPQNYVSAVKVLENAHLLIMRGATGVGEAGDSDQAGSGCGRQWARYTE